MATTTTTMLGHFTPRHIFPLSIALVNCVGGLMPVFAPRRAMLGFGFPESTADTPAMHPVMVTCSARTSVIGALIAAFYWQRKLADVDTIMAVFGLWVGIADVYALWGLKDSKIILRFVSGMAVGVWGLLGMTAW